MREVGYVLYSCAWGWLESGACNDLVPVHMVCRVSGYRYDNKFET